MNGMNSDNLAPASWSDAGVEPPAYQRGPRCGHGAPMALACPQCADPIGVEPRSSVRPASLPAADAGAWWVGLVMLLLAFALGVAVGLVAR